MRRRITILTALVMIGALVLMAPMAEAKKKHRHHRGSLSLRAVYILPRSNPPPPIPIFDDFDQLDPTRWTKSQHELGRSSLSPSNVDTSGGNLQIKLPANSTDGGEIASKDLYGYGSYAARMRTPYAPSSITGFFLYKAPDYQSEIDVELYNDGSRRIMFTTYAGGAQTHTQTMQLPFDPKADFHEYRFDYAPDSLKFYADNHLMRSWANGLPQEPMNIYLNAWFPSWLSGTPSAKDNFVYVDSISKAISSP